MTRYERQFARIIKQTAQFKRDIKRAAKGKHRETLEEALMPLLDALAKDEPLPFRYSDHALTGNWKNYRDCHIKPDFVLIYQMPDEETLILVRLGSHSELHI